MRSLFLLTGAALLGLAACHRDAPAPNPCLSQQANPLRFRFLEGYGTPTPDTAYTKQDITFEGPGAPYTSYEWKVGNDARVFTKQKFSPYFTFGSSWRGINFNYGGDDFSCHTEVGTGYLTTRDSIRIVYSRNETFPNRKDYVFRGRRVR